MSDRNRSVYGIDLSTTYSCISQVEKFDHAVVLRYFGGNVTTPSVVYVNGDEVIVGKEAKSLSVIKKIVRDTNAVNDNPDSIWVTIRFKRTNEKEYRYRN